MKGHNYGLCRKCGKTHINPIAGKPRTREWNDNISKAKKGKKNSKEHDKKVSDSLKRIYESGERIPWNSGKTKDNNESVKKISESNMGHIPWNKGKTGVYSQETLKIMSENHSKYYEDHPEAKMFGSDNPASRPDVKKKIGDGNRGKCHSEEHNKKISLAGIGKHSGPRPSIEGEKNHFYNKHHTEKTCLLISQKVKEAFQKNPECHSNRKFGKMGFVSLLQQKLYNIAKDMFIDVELEYPIFTNTSMRYADVALSSLKVDLEADGKYWHNDIEKDIIRDDELKLVGWRTFRFYEDESIEDWMNKLNILRGELLLEL